MRFAAVLAAGWLIVCTGADSAEAQEPMKLPGLSAPVTVTYDAHAIPHIFADTWADAYRVIGALHASERLLQMEFNRRLGSGLLAEVLGPDGLESDKLMRRLGIRRSCQEFWDSPDVPPEMKSDFAAYSEGVNAVLTAMGMENLPAVIKGLGLQPAAWNPVDSLVFLKYMAWDQSGTADDLWLGRVLEKLGPHAAEELWPLERPYEIPTVRRQFDRRTWTWKDAPFGETTRWAARMPTGIEPLLRSAQQAVDRARWFPRGLAFGSNNWVVDGTKTASGKPILCNDPHLGFQLPSIWYAAHICVSGFSVAGVTFPGCPVVIIGHNDKVGWGITNMQADAVDYYVETVHPDNPRQYLHRGEWKAMHTISEAIPVRGGEPVIFEIESTLHGPIISREGQAISMAWTGVGPTRDSAGLWRMNRATNIHEFLDALDDVAVPALNLVYADVEGNIAMHTMGRLPLRLRGQGRLPMDGSSGDSDWGDWIPREDLPLAVNPPEHYLASANGRPHPVGYPHYVGWMWDPSYRTRRIAQMLESANGLTLETMKAIQTDAKDFAAEQFLPILLAPLKATPPTDPFEQQVVQALSEWDFVATLDTVAPLLWQRWFDLYREAVWDDEWETRGIAKEGGSWGFTGDNRREPMLEVLEFLTKEFPQSPWFDDRRTPGRETRDDIALMSFHKMIELVKSRHGADLAAYAWKNFNVVRVSPLVGDPMLGRTGGPVVGTSFTVNPGGDGGHVGGGACWRMIVDFADPSGSQGVYPGGQSGDPTQSTYADLLPIWETLQYVPLHAHATVDALPAAAKVTTRQFVP